MLKFYQILLFTLFNLSSPIHAATYYFSNQGNDTNNGLSEATPWQTITRLNTFTFSDGDVILFKRGEVFRGAINALKSPKNITYGAYGAGENPVIAGSVPLTGWQPSSLGTGIYQVELPQLPLTDTGIVHLFVNGRLMTIARYPNVNSPAEKNWLKVSSKGNNGFSDSVLASYKKPNDYWKGATLRIRNYSWTYTVLPVTGYQAASGKLSVPGLGEQLPEWGYFLDGVLSELDYPGEWYFDATKKIVYLYPPSGVDIRTALVEAAIYDVGISVTNQENNTVIENLTFRHFTNRGIHIGISDNPVVRNCRFEHNTAAVSVWNNTNVLIANNMIDNQLEQGIVLQASTDFAVKQSVVEKNTITNTALYPGYGVRTKGVYQGIAISAFGKAYTVRQNVIENVSHAGIDLKDGGYHLIENNVVRNALLLLNDGGALVISSNGNTIRGNFFLNSLGNTDESNGCGSLNQTPCMHHPSYGMGIGANNNYKDNVIEGNTVANNLDMGIRLNAFLNTVVRNNVIYNNDPQIAVEDKKGDSRNNLIEGNIIYSLHPEQIGISLTNATHHGELKNNYYCNPYSEIAVLRNNRRYSLAHWQNDFPQYDKQSTFCKVQFPQYAVTPTSADMVKNSRFDTGVDGWKGSGNPQHISHETTTILDGGSLKAFYKGLTGNLNVTSEAFTITQDQWYRLTFSVIGDGFGNIQLRSNRTEPAYLILEERFFAVDKLRKDYSFVFKAKESTNSLKHLFITDAEDMGTYWLDNISFESITANLNDAQSFSPLFMNPSNTSKTIDLKGNQYVDLNGKIITGSLTLAPFSSQILLLTGQSSLNPNATVPAAPKLSLTKKGITVSATWNTVEKAKGYYLYYAPYPNAEYVAKVDLGVQTQLTTELWQGAAFYVAIKAYNAVGESEYSNIEFFVIQ